MKPPAQTRHGSTAAPPWLRGLLLGLLCVGLAGCVQRRMTIRSSPPGALVYVDDYQIGTAPVSTDFVYYGTRKIRLVKDGYETLTVRQPFPVPWYEVFPLDFVTENLLPWEIRDERVVDLAMVPAASTPSDAVVGRAELARRSAGSGPPPPAPPVPVTAPAGQPAALPLPPPAVGPSFPAPPPMGPDPGLQPPAQNAPTQGVPGLGGPGFGSPY